MPLACWAAGRAARPRRAARGARLGPSGVLVLSGEPGIGKSALLERRRGARGRASAAAGPGTEAEHDLPFAGLAAAPAPARSTGSRRLPPPQAQALGVALALREGGAVDRFAVSAAALTLLATAASEDRPVGAGRRRRPPARPAVGGGLAFVARRLLADAVVRAGRAAPRRDATPGTGCRCSTVAVGGLDETPARRWSSVASGSGADRGAGRPDRAARRAATRWRASGRSPATPDARPPVGLTAARGRPRRWRWRLRMRRATAWSATERRVVRGRRRRRRATSPSWLAPARSSRPRRRRAACAPRSSAC